jgi:hypothetical protein
MMIFPWFIVNAENRYPIIVGVFLSSSSALTYVVSAYTYMTAGLKTYANLLLLIIITGTGLDALATRELGGALSTNSKRFRR